MSQDKSGQQKNRRSKQPPRPQLKLDHVRTLRNGGRFIIETAATASSHKLPGNPEIQFLINGVSHGNPVTTRNGREVMAFEDLEAGNYLIEITSKEVLGSQTLNVHLPHPTHRLEVSDPAEVNKIWRATATIHVEVPGKSDVIAENEDVAIFRNGEFMGVHPTNKAGLISYVFQDLPVGKHVVETALVATGEHRQSIIQVGEKTGKAAIINFVERPVQGTKGATIFFLTVLTKDRSTVKGAVVRVTDPTEDTGWVDLDPTDAHGRTSYRVSIPEAEVSRLLTFTIGDYKTDRPAYWETE